MQRDEDLLVVASGFALWVDDEEAVLPGIETAAEILPRKGVAMIPARARRRGIEAEAPRLARLDHRRALFHRAIDLRRDLEPVPMHDVGSVGHVRYCDRDPLSFAHANHRPGNLVVVA